MLIRCVRGDVGDVWLAVDALMEYMVMPKLLPSNLHIPNFVAGAEVSLFYGNVPLVLLPTNSLLPSIEHMRTLKGTFLFLG